MKRTGLFVPLFALLLTACSERDSVSGNIVFEISDNIEVTDMVRSAVSDYTELPSGDDFSISLTNSLGASVWSGKAGAWDSSTALPVGDYSVTATYGAEGEEGFDKPFFSGSANFTLTGGNAQTVKIPVKLQNTIVRVKCTERFDNYFTGYTFSLKTGAGSTVDIARGQTKAVFMDAYKFTLTGSLVNQGGAAANFGPKEYENLEAATCYTLKFDATDIGGLKLQITFNENVETVDLGPIELN